MQWISNNLPYLLAGISVGGQYALIAIGYSMVYGILRLINFAHGDIFMVAGLIMVYASASMPFYASIPLTLALTVVLGFAVERIAYKPLRTAPRMSVMISAIGVSYLLQNVALYVTGGLSKEYPAIPWLSDSVVVLGATTKRVTVITPILTIVLIVLLVLLINHTKVGMGMRAVSKDFETSLLMGIKIDSVISVTFIIRSEERRVGKECRRDPRHQGLYRGGIRRYRLGARRCHRRVYHRHLREHHQGAPPDHLLRRIYLRAAHSDPDFQAHRSLR